MLPGSKRFDVLTKTPNVKDGVANLVLLEIRYNLTVKIFSILLPMQDLSLCNTHTTYIL